MVATDFWQSRCREQHVPLLNTTVYVGVTISHLFQIRFADTEQYWSITLTFRNTVRRGTLLVERRSPISQRDQGAIAVRHGTWCARQGQLFGARPCRITSAVVCVIVCLSPSCPCGHVQRRTGFETHSWPVQSEQKGSHLLLARRPPSLMLNILLYGSHWGLSRWRPVQSLQVCVTARPATKAPVTPLYLRGRRCAAAPNGREQPTTHVPQPLLLWVRRLRAGLALYGL